MVGFASPFDHADGQSRDVILEAIRTWASENLLTWSGSWQTFFNGWITAVDAYISANATQGIQGIPGPNNIPADTFIGGQVNTAGSATQIALDGRYERGTLKTVYVDPTGLDTNNGKTAGTAKRTLAGALSAMGANTRGTIRLGAGIIDAGAGVAWGAYTCNLIGLGVGTTIIQTTAQNGPALDFTGIVGYSMNGAEIGGFSILGDGVANPANKGIALSNLISANQFNMHDIQVRNTGGACFDFGIAEVCDFNRLYAFTPINASAGNVPYVMATGPFNGNRITGLQLYGLGSTANVGVSGALLIKENGTNAPEYNTLDSPLFEHLILPAGATVIALQGNANTISNIQPEDCSKVVGATGTSHVRLTPPVGMDSGGTLITGVIPGNDNISATWLDCGIDVRQSRNSVIGTKGYRGTNVKIAAGIGNTYTMIGGGVSSAVLPAVIDSSGLQTNVSIDQFNQLESMGKYSIQPAVNTAGPQFFDPAIPGNGGIEFGNSGSRLQQVGPTLYQTSDSITFRAIDLTMLGYADKTAGWLLHGALQLTAPGTSTSATAGAAAALPATPAGYLTVTIDGTARKIPYY